MPTKPITKTATATSTAPAARISHCGSNSSSSLVPAKPTASEESSVRTHAAEVRCLASSVRSCVNSVRCPANSCFEMPSSVSPTVFAARASGVLPLVRSRMQGRSPSGLEPRGSANVDVTLAKLGRVMEFASSIKVWESRNQRRTSCLRRAPFRFLPGDGSPPTRSVPLAHRPSPSSQPQAGHRWDSPAGPAPAETPRR